MRRRTATYAPTAGGGLLGALASSPLGTTVARGILGGLITGVVADVVIKGREKQALPQVASRPAAGVGVTGGLLLPDGQPLNPPATPGDLAEQQMVKQYIDQRQGAASEVPDKCVVGAGGGYACGTGAFDKEAFADIINSMITTTIQ